MKFHLRRARSLNYVRRRGH